MNPSAPAKTPQKPAIEYVVEPLQPGWSRVTAKLHGRTVLLMAAPGEEALIREIIADMSSSDLSKNLAAYSYIAKHWRDLTPRPNTQPKGTAHGTRK